MKTKRVIVGGAGTSTGSNTRRSVPLVLAMALLGLSMQACKPGSNGQENGTPADPGPAVAQGADVVRYSGMEVVESGQAGIRQAVQARRAADYSSPTVATLYPGTMVNHVARYGGYSLISWTGSAGAQTGWVSSNVAFSTVIIDAGVGIQPPTAFGATTINQQPTVTAPPVVTAPPPVATTPPKPTATVTPPPPKPTATPPRTGFKPPKLN